MCFRNKADRFAQFTGCNCLNFINLSFILFCAFESSTALATAWMADICTSVDVLATCQHTLTEWKTKYGCLSLKWHHDVFLLDRWVYFPTRTVQLQLVSFRSSCIYDVLPTVPLVLLEMTNRPPQGGINAQEKESTGFLELFRFEELYSHKVRRRLSLKTSDGVMHWQVEE